MSAQAVGSKMRVAQPERVEYVEHAVAMDEYDAWKQLLDDKNVVPEDYLPGGRHYISPTDV